MRCLALLLILTALPWGESSPLPRYRLDVGRELTFTGSTLYVGEEARFSESQIWTVWVLRRNPDGTARLLIQNENRLTPEDAKGVPVDDTTKDSSIAYIDLSDDGRGAWNPTMGLMLDPARLFPPLPREDSETRSGWSRSLPDGEVWSYKTAPDAGKSIVYAAARATPWDKVYGLSWKETLTFDRDAGAIGTLQREDVQTFGFGGKGRELVKLAGVSRLAEDRARRLAEDSEVYFRARKILDDQAARAQVAADPETIANVGVDAMKEARARVRERVFQSQIDADLARHKNQSVTAHPWATELASTLGRPALGFDLEDLKGKHHTLDQYRGKVVVLDFWNRETGWSLKALPQVQGLLADFRDRPVVVLGMNTDLNENDAWFVVHALGLEHPTLRASRTASAMNITACPATIVIDREGQVAHIQIGYSRTRRDELRKVIEALLAAPPR